MDDIRSKEYAQFLEQTLENLMELPVAGIGIVVKMEDGGVMTSFFRSKVMDKLMYAGVIQQEAMMDSLKINGMIEDKRPDTD